MSHNTELAATDELLMSSTVTVEITDGPDKLVTLPTESTAVAMGMHDELAGFYGAPKGYIPHASTLDYVIGAAGACLAGTFKRALAARGIKPAKEDLATRAIGDIVAKDGVPVIRRIRVEYVLGGVDEADRATVERVLAVHHRGCAVSRSLEGPIEIETTLTVR